MNKKRLIVRLKGGIGNQLFCYAAARRLALTNQAELVLDHVTGFSRDHLYRRKYLLERFNIPCRKATSWERMEPFERYRRAWVKLTARRKPFEFRNYVEQEGIDFDPRLLTFKVEGTIYLDGLWQSEGYFKDVEEIIRQDLQITPPDDLQNQEMAAKIDSCNAVAIHVRWFNGPHDQTPNHNIGHDYYKRAVKEIMDKLLNPHFFVFSDNPEAARNMLPLTNEMITCVDHNQHDDNACADLWLMTLCKHFIIANSTFSWWGAWLADDKSKIVITPKIELTGVTAWGFRGIIPDTWTQL